MLKALKASRASIRHNSPWKSERVHDCSPLWSMAIAWRTCKAITPSSQGRNRARSKGLSPAQHRKVTEPPPATSQAVSPVSSKRVVKYF